MDLPKRTTHLAVIGGGPGGYAAAFMAADLGLQTVLIDLDKNPGGVCLHRGCIPSKALLHVAKVLNEAREAEHWGVNFSQPEIDLNRLRASKDAVVAKMTGGLGQLCKARSITLLQGRAGFIDANSLRVHFGDGDSQEVHFQYAIVATGSRPAIIPALALESPRVMNSTDALELESIPKTLLVIGGGYIGLELSSVYAALGSEVTIVDIASQLLPGADVDLVKPLAARMESMCHEIHLETGVATMEETKTGIRATLDGPYIKRARQTFEKVLVSVGRKPNSSGLGLSNTKVEINEAGFIEVDNQMRTAQSHLFAIGDVVGQPMLAHKATHEGRVAAEVIAGKSSVFEPRAIPAIVFTDPEVAWCGLTETEAKKQDRAIKVTRFPWAASGRATTLNRNEGLTKMLTDPETEEVLGVGIVGVGAGELIAEATLAIEMGAVAADIDLTIHPHPTLSETIMEAAEMVSGRSTHIYRPSRKPKPKEAG